MANERPVWRRKSSIVNVRQQVWFALEIVLMAIFFVMMCMVFLFMPPMDSWFVSPDYSRELVIKILEIILLKWPLVFAAMIATFTFGLLFSHRLAGPLFGLKRATERWMSGDRSARVYFRKYDYLLPAKDSLNNLFDTYQKAIDEAVRIGKEIESSSGDEATKKKAHEIVSLLEINQDVSAKKSD